RAAPVNPPSRPALLRFVSQSSSEAAYFSQEQRASFRRLAQTSGWPRCSSRQATTLLSFDIRWDLGDVDRANRRRSSRRSSWSGRLFITVGGDRGFDARG